MPLSAPLLIKCLSVFVILLSLSTFLGSFPSKLLPLLLQEGALAMAPYGIMPFFLLFTLGTLLLAPAMLLAMLSGVCFSYPRALAITLGASFLTASLAFWTTRIFGRSRISRYLKRHPFAAAIDSGLLNDGWKCIVFTRISPFIPFGIQNYLYGLSSIPFSIYIVTTCIAIVPGALLYTYVGYLTKASVTTLQTSSSLELLIQIPGYLGTLLFLYYIRRLLRRASKVTASVADHGRYHQQANSIRGSFPWVLWAILISVPLLYIAHTPTIRVKLLSLLPGPPRIIAQERYDETPVAATIDHNDWDTLLSTYVNEHGFVQYNQLGQDRQLLDAYLSQLATVSLENLGRNERLAFYLNGYNACTLNLVLDHYPIVSINDIPDSKRWHHEFCRLAGHTYSLHDIEHTILRKDFREPRIHFALVCASKGCPPLRREAYRGVSLEQQLDDQTWRFFNDSRWFTYEQDSNTMYLSTLLWWYSFDFLQYAPNLSTYAGAYSQSLAAQTAEGNIPDIQWIAFDWSLNDATSNAVSDSN